MTLLGSLRARSPSPSAELFTARGLINPVNPPSSTASFAAPTTILHQPSLVPSGSLSTPTGTLAPASPSARRTTSKRVLVPKKVANADPTSAQDKENVYPHVPESTKSNTRKGSQIPIPTFPVARAPSKYLTQRTTHAKPAPLQPHSEWKVVPPPPPPRTVGQPHQFASARRYAVSGSNSVRSDTAPKPEPVAILPVKMDDGGSRTTAQRSIRIVTGNSSIRGASLRSTGTVRTQRENTLRTQMEDQLPEPTPLFVKKKKSRLALDLTWALGDRTNAPSKEKEIPLASPSQPPKPEGPTIKSKSSMSKLTMTLKRKVSGNFRSSELTEDASKDSGKERWKWSLGRRGRKDVKDSLSKHAKSPSPPPAIRNIPTFSSATGSAEYEYRTPSLDDHPPVIDLPPIDTEPLFVPTPSTSSAVPSLSASRDGSLRLPLSIHIPSDISALTAGPSTAISAVNASPAPGPRIRFNSYIEAGGRSSPVIRDRAVSATFDSPLRESQDMNQDAPTKNHRDSIALRAMRSVRSMARIFVLPEDDTSGHLTRKLSKRAKSKSRASESETGSEPLTRRSSNASQESWLVGAPSIVDNPPPSPGRACGPIDLPIVSSAAREEMTAENRPLSPEVELPRPSVETFGTLRIQKGRMSHDTKRTFSVASNLSELSSGSGKSSASSNRKSNRTSDILRDESTKGSVSSSGRLSFGSIISTRPSKASANRAPSDAPPKGTARKRGSLANLFELAGGIRSSASSKRSSILSRESKASDESHPTGVDTPCTSPCDETPKAKPGVLERIKSFHTLNTIPASPASVFKEIDDQAALEDTLVNRKARSGSNARPRLPSFEQIPPVPQLRVELDCDVAPQVEPTHPIPSAFPRTPDVNSTVKPRPVSENILGAWGSQRRPATDECPTDGALSLVSAATDELGDLINRLDLSTPDCSPARSHATGHKNSPAPSSLEDARKWQWDPIQLPKGIFDDQAFDENSIPGTTSTFGRAAATKLLRPKQDFLAVPSPLAHPAASETCGLQEDESYVLDGLDSPLKNRRKVDGRTSGLQVLGKSSTGSSLTAVDRSAKGSTGTVLCILKEPGEGDLSMGSENPGDVSLGAFGKGLVDRVEDSREMSEVDDSDIPEELHDILSSRSDSLSLRTEDGRTPFYDISIPSTASALMAKTNLPSIAPPIEICNRPSVRSAPPHPVPAEPLPPAPSMSSRFPVPTDEDDVEDSMDDSILTDSSTGSPAANNAKRCSTAGIHEPTMNLDHTDEEDSPAQSDVDPTDDTGKASFDFTKELNRLNQGGTRQSFVAELAHAFNPPKPFDFASREVPPFTLGDTERQKGESNGNTLGKPEVRPSASQSTIGGTSFAVGPADTTLFAVANLDLSLVYPSGEPKAPPREEPSDAVLADTAALVRAVSLSESLDASMSALAKLNVSQADPPKDRPHSSSLESERVAKRHARIANARVNRRLERARNQSTVTASSYGSVINSPDPDPFSYTLAKLEGRIVDSSFNSSRSQNQSTFSIPSISSYGVIINPGVKNPFGYDTSTDSSYASPTGDARSSSDSDRSNFFFNSNAAQPAQADRPRDSFLSTFSANNGPPISLLNRPRMAQYGGRPDSFDGTMFSGPGGVYRSPCSGFSRDRDSIISNVSINRLGRPGLGDKMFESEPLYAISASPPSGSSSVEVGRRESLDPRFSIGSVGSRFGKYSSVSSIFDKTRSRPSSVSSASIFNIDESHASILRSTLPLRVNKQLRPLSMWSTASALESPDEDDTMVTMLGGEQVRIPRAAMGPSVTGSPCVQAEKKRKRGIQLRSMSVEDEFDSSPNKARLIGSESVASVRFSLDHIEIGRELSFDQSKSDAGQETETGVDSGFTTTESSHIFDQSPLNSADRMDWENTADVQITQGPNPLLFRIAPPDTPPLSCSSSAGSQSSIDVEKLKFLLEQSGPPPVSAGRLRPHGKGHRRRSQQSYISRTSVIESIAEEVPGHNGSPQAPKHDSFVTSPEHPIIVWDPQINRDSWRDSRDWDTEFGVMLQRYYAFQHQAKEAVEESKLVWPDTEYSRFSLQSFYPPRDPVAIQALIEHSQKTFGPLPLELCVRNPRSRANSRPSPYPMRVAPQHVKLTAFARSHRRTESAERAFECITPFDMPILPAQPASRASLDSVAPSVTMAAPSPSSRDTSQSTSPRATAAEPTDTRRSILSRLRRVPADKTNQFSPLKESGGYKRAESVKSAKHGHHHASAFAKENRETEGHGLLPGPNPSLRISKAKPPRARRAGALSSTMKALRF